MVALPHLISHPLTSRLIVAFCFLLAGFSLSQASPPPAAAFHSRRVLILPRDQTSLKPLNQFHAQRHRSVARTFVRQGGLQIVQLPPDENVEDVIARYRASGLVQFAEPDYVVTAAITLPSDPRFQDGTQWGMNNYGQNGGAPGADIDAPSAWDVLHNSSNVVIAIVDSGVRETHEDLAGNLWTNPSDGSHGFNALTGRHDPTDDYGHGTALAGIIGAVTDNGKGVAGVTWKAQLMACKFLDASGNGFISDAIACIEFARTNGAGVINLSWGGDGYSAALSNALWYARADGIIVAAAAGNTARDTDVTPFYPADIQLDNIVSVGASTRLDGAWSLSNHGMRSVHLFAPGAAIYSTASGSDTAYATRDGTSMATAYVSGALALMRSQEPTATIWNLRSWLFAAVDYGAAFSGKCATGGRLNLRKALDRPTLAATPGVWPFAARISGAPDHRYVIIASTNLSDWTALQTNTVGASGEWNFLDTQTNLPMRFYRAGPRP
jgi:subtilisin family serine protease